MAKIKINWVVYEVEGDTIEIEEPSILAKFWSFLFWGDVFNWNVKVHSSNWTQENISWTNKKGKISVGGKTLVELTWTVKIEIIGDPMNVDGTNLVVNWNVHWNVDGTNITISWDVGWDVGGTNVRCWRVAWDVDGTIVRSM